MNPYQYGGGMIAHVHTYSSDWATGPQRFEAGTPPIASAVGLATAIRFIQQNIDYKNLQEHESSLCRQLIEGLSDIKKATIYGSVDQLQKKGHIVSFNLRGSHPHDIAAYCDSLGSRIVFVMAERKICC